jgi:acyl-CoA reductase-like NAD-dependent aldehyde dehydrogenase
MATTIAELRSINPATETEIERFPVMSDHEVDTIVEAVHNRFAGWRATPMQRRGDLLRAAAETLRKRADELAAVLTAEMGKPITEARAEVTKCATSCDYYASNAERFLADEPAPSDTPHSFVSFEPLGTVLAIMPWNFPLWQVFRFAAPGLMAGNTAVLKHAGNCTRSALEIEAVFREAGFPDDVFRTLVVPGDRVGRIIADPRIVAATLTGSDFTGAKVAATAGENLKKTVLELGGSDAFIVLEDADIAAAAEVAVKARFQNCGQSCIAAKRFLVVDSVADEFESAFVDNTRKLRVGDPSRDETQMGPLARDDLRSSLERQLSESLTKGARLLTGGHRPEGRGWFFEPTVVGDCRLDMPAFNEETFGPLAAVMRVSSADEAVTIANNSQYGLGGNVWTRDPERGKSIARRLETGGVFINGMTHSDARLPFGGVKRSGYGRELSSFGIREFVNIKTVWLPETPEAAAPGANGGSPVE